MIKVEDREIAVGERGGRVGPQMSSKPVDSAKRSPEAVAPVTYAGDE